MNMYWVRRSADNPMWDIRAEARFDYRFPLPIDHDMTGIGRTIGNITPVDTTMYQLGPFIVSKSPESHIGPFKWAIDFLVLDGTPILAARDGWIRDISLKWQKWGPTSDSANYLNYITISHGDEYSQYCHVAFPTLNCPQLVRVGDEVKAGQPISYVEKNGWTDRDHLHFMVFEDNTICNWNEFGFRSLKVTFK